MSQDFTELQGNDTLTNSRAIINNNFNAIKSGFSGTNPPFAASADTLGATYFNTTDNKTYQVIRQGASYAWGLPKENLHTSGNESFSGTLDATTGVVKVATQGVTDNSTNAASTAFVRLKVPVSVGSSIKPVYTNSNGVITASDATVGSASQPVYMNNGVITAITGAIANNITGNAATATAAVTKNQGDNSTNIATTEYVDTGLSTKQATLVSGTNIKTINNNSLVGSGNVNIDSLPSQHNQGGKFLTTNGQTASWETIQQSPDVDNKSISLNSSDELQTVGVIDQRDSTTAIKTWTGTKQQYDAIATKDSNTVYNITDDTTPSNFANVDLSNLSQTGQAVIDGKANTSLSNLNSTGQALFTAKLDADKIQQVSTLPVSPVAGTLYLIPE